MCFSSAIYSIRLQYDVGFVKKDWLYSVLNISIEMYIVISQCDLSSMSTASFTCTNLLQPAKSVLAPTKGSLASRDSQSNEIAYN
jgi:hypothetical protein